MVSPKAFDNEQMRRDKERSMRIWIGFIIIIFSCVSLAQVANLRQEQSLVDRIATLPLPGAFVQTVRFSLRAHTQIDAIVYGNREIGYFSSKNFARDSSGISLTFIPPTYRHEIEFSLIEAGSQRPVSLGRRLFKNPLAGGFDGGIHVRMPLSVPFVIMDWSFAVRVPGLQTAPIVINRLGEVIWMFRRPDGRQRMADAFEVLDDGRFIFVNQYDSSDFVMTDSFGKILINFEFQDKKLPGNSHTIQYLADTNELLYLSFDCRELSRREEFVPLFRGLQGWFRLFTLPRRTYRGSKLLRLSLDTFQVREIWNSFRDFSPGRFPSLAVGGLTPADHSMDAASAEDYLASAFSAVPEVTWYDWPKKYCNVDWTHENSAQYVPGKGYLISIRNLNKIILLDEDGRMKWTIGEGPANDFRFARDGSGFSLQHSAHFLPDGRVALYDNHSAYRGQSGIRYGNRVMIVNPAKPGQIRPDVSVLMPTSHSDVRGSIMPLRNGHLLSYSAGNPGNRTHFFELDPVTSRFTGWMQVDLYMGLKGFEAKPVYSFAGDRWLTTDWQSPESKQRSPSKGDPFADSSAKYLQFSY